MIAICSCSVDPDGHCTVHGMNRAEISRADYYTRAVEHFKANPHRIASAWNQPEQRDYGLLFAPVTRRRSSVTEIPYPFVIRPGVVSQAKRMVVCGNPIEVAAGERRAETMELTRAIRADTFLAIAREPDDVAIYPHLLIFLAEWQRRIDLALDRAAICTTFV